MRSTIYNTNHFTTTNQKTYHKNKINDIFFFFFSETTNDKTQHCHTYTDTTHTHNQLTWERYLPIQWHSQRTLATDRLNNRIAKKQQKKKSEIQQTKKKKTKEVAHHAPAGKTASHAASSLSVDGLVIAYCHNVYTQARVHNTISQNSKFPKKKNSKKKT